MQVIQNILCRQVQLFSLKKSVIANERKKQRKREILIDFNVKDRTEQSEIINKTTLIRAEDGSFNRIFVFSGPRPFTWAWPLVPAFNLGLPALAPNFYLPVQVSNLYLSVLAPNLCLPALAPNLYLPALVLKFVFAIPGPNLYLPILAPNVCLPQCVFIIFPPWSLNCVYQPWLWLCPPTCIYQSRSKCYYYHSYCSQICIRRPLLEPLKSGRLIKHLYKTTTKQMWSLLAGFQFFIPTAIFA